MTDPEARPDPPASLANTAGPRHRRRGRLVAGLAAAAALIGVGVWAGTYRSSAPGVSVAPLSGPARSAATASYTRLDGGPATLGSLRGRPVMVWFVADGCASCAVSIPAVADHLSAFARSNTQVVVLGLYGAFDTPAALSGFATSTAGPAFANPAWTWGLASEQLTAAYDPDGIPDAYYLVDPTGRITYRNSVPVSTMSALLAHLPANSAAGTTTAGAPTASSTGAP